MTATVEVFLPYICRTCDKGYAQIKDTGKQAARCTTCMSLDVRPAKDGEVYVCPGCGRFLLKYEGCNCMQATRTPPGLATKTLDGRDYPPPRAYPLYDPTNPLENMHVPEGLRAFSLTNEEWREYDFGEVQYRIDNPLVLMYKSGGLTHRVVDAKGVTHCLPAPGRCMCVVKWKTKDPNRPVDF